MVDWRLKLKRRNERLQAKIAALDSMDLRHDKYIEALDNIEAEYNTQMNDILKT